MGSLRDCGLCSSATARGDSDLVTRISGMGLCSEEFIERINPKKYGYQVADGMHTDVYALKRRGLGISCVNISCGYYEPHTDHEYTVLKDLAKCYRLVRHIVCCHKEVSRHTPSPVRRFMPGYYELFGERGYDEELFMLLSKKIRTTHAYWPYTFRKKEREFRRIPRQAGGYTALTGQGGDRITVSPHYF